jgi:hypothetical protein
MVIIPKSQTMNQNGFSISGSNSKGLAVAGGSKSVKLGELLHVLVII